MISLVVIYTNGMVAVFDDKGEQVTELQGRFGIKAEAISAQITDYTQLQFAKWRGATLSLVDKESFDRLWKREME